MLLQLIANQPRVVLDIVVRTPPWVGVLLAALVALGLAQTRRRTAGFARVAALPLAMGVWSLWGTVMAFRQAPNFDLLLLAWFTAWCWAVAALVMLPAAPTLSYDRAARRFTLPGSWLPLALMLGIFLTKYIVGVELAMQPALGADRQFALVTAVLYGTFSGLFAGRAARLLRLVWRQPHGKPVAA